jgi:hypothetical protein
LAEEKPDGDLEEFKGAEAEARKESE